MHNTMYHVMGYFLIVLFWQQTCYNNMLLNRVPSQYFHVNINVSHLMTWWMCVCFNKKSYVVEISEKSNQCLEQRAASVGWNKVQMNAERLNLSLSLIAWDHFIACTWECREVGNIAACTWISQTSLSARLHHPVDQGISRNFLPLSVLSLLALCKQGHSFCSPHSPLFTGRFQSFSHMFVSSTHMSILIQFP